MQQNEANQLIRSGLAALQQKRAPEARKAFETLVNNGFKNASIWLALGYAYRDSQDPQKAHEAAKKSIELEGRNPRAYILRADIYYSEGDHHSASAFYRVALGSTPPGGQIPPDLAKELDHAKKRYEHIVNRYTDHLKDLMSDDIAAAGNDGRRAQMSIDIMTGQKQAYTQQPTNYYFPELPNIQFYDKANFDWVDTLEAATDTIRAELKGAIAQASKDFTAYLEHDDDRPQHDPHGMRGSTDWSAFFLWQDGKIVKKNAAKCPETVKIMKNIVMPEIEGRAPNVLFSMLKPGAKIPPHHGLINTRLICHLPLIIPENCGFRVGNDVREWEEGKVWLFDDTIEHEAWNNGDRNRYILIFEVWRPELSETEHKLIAKILESVDSYKAQ